MYTIAGTGHRPQHLTLNGKLRAFSIEQERILNTVAEERLKRIKAANPSLRVISGMALGWDMALAQACVTLNIPFIAAVPFEGQERRWNGNMQELYRSLLGLASEVVHVSEPGYAGWKMHVRNEWMVDRADAVLALWNGNLVGGTGACIRYATKKNVPIINAYEDFVTRVEALS